MIDHPRFNLILAMALTCAILLTGVLIFLPRETQETAAAAVSQPEYVNRLFAGSQVITIDIQVDASTWQTMLDQAQQEQYIVADVVINGTTFSSVGIRPKGNSSLTQSSGSGTGRVSLKIEFDHNVKEQTCFGLDKLVLNNTQSDATYMKDYLSYKMMADLGVPAPLCAFADITVNGAGWGCYLAVEALEESFAARNYGSDYGQLYNVKSMDMNNAGKDSATGESNADGFPDASAFPNRGQMPNQNNAGNFGNLFGAGRSGGGDLVYTTDDPADYSAIFDNAAFDPTSGDQKAVIAALKNLSTGAGLEQSFNVDEILRYLAVHTVTVNLDSYVSSMQQNYYIYEQDGQISILPWDYNLAYGGFQSGDASSVVNFPIDTPVSGVELADRPLIAQLLANETYRTQYHQYLQEIVDTWLLGGKFAATVDQTDALIGDLVKNDATAFFTEAQYQAALKQIKLFAALRGESIQGQLNGTVPATTEGQSADPSALIDASSLDLTAMGSQGGGNMAGFPGNGGKTDSGQSAMPGIGGYSGKGQLPDSNRQNPFGGGERPSMPNNGQSGFPANGQNMTAPEVNAGAIAGGLTQSSFIGSGVEAAVIGISLLCLLLGLAYVMRFRKRRSCR